MFLKTLACVGELAGFDLLASDSQSHRVGGPDRLERGATGILQALLQVLTLFLVELVPVIRADAL
jgi:hypothetical protein